MHVLRNTHAFIAFCLTKMGTFHNSLMSEYAFTTNIMDVEFGLR